MRILTTSQMLLLLLLAQSHTVNTEPLSLENRNNVMNDLLCIGYCVRCDQFHLI